MKKIKGGDLVKLKPDAAEGDAESVGIGLIIEEGKDNYGQEFIYIQFLKGSGKPWFRYKDEVELVSEDERRTGER